MSYARSTKRQFQPQISSFFPPSTSSASTSSTVTTTHALNRAYSDAITLPDHVQANLLSVGMRVRKAVPEGYKNIDARPSISASPASPAPALLPATAPVAVHSTRSTRPAELTPFCGIHKTGGLHDAAYAFDDDDFNFPAGSQESFASAVSVADSEVASAQNVRKRGMADEFDEGFGEEIDAAADADVSFDPAFFDERLFGMLERGGGASIVPERPIARAVTRRQTPGSRGPVRPAVDDFDEADFLKPSGVDVDMEG